MKKTTFAIVGTGIVGERIINQLRNNDLQQLLRCLMKMINVLQEMADTYGLYAASSYEEVLGAETGLGLYRHSACIAC